MVSSTRVSLWQDLICTDSLRCSYFRVHEGKSRERSVTWSPHPAIPPSDEPTFDKWRRNGAAVSRHYWLGQAYKMTSFKPGPTSIDGVRWSISISQVPILHSQWTYIQGGLSIQRVVPSLPRVPKYWHELLHTLYSSALYADRGRCEGRMGYNSNSRMRRIFSESGRWNSFKLPMA